MSDLVLGVRTYPDGTKFIRVLIQKHRYDDFNNGSNIFDGSNGMRIASYYHPEVNYPNEPSTFYVRGIELSRDKVIMRLPENEEYLNLVKSAVKEYNAR